ncbi:MAG TPA: protein phosphatase 2C domain-containing protein [Burkholderiaceae bacterium]|nr:protein phosphatase 2C domain-containing protein [Burkholderiaceae bacterium]
MTSFKVNVCVAQHIGDRQEQQDRVAIITSPRNPGAMLAIVADGMGGRTGGRMAADQVVSTAENLFKDMTERDSTFRDMLLHLAAEAHTVIRLTAISSEKEPHSTLCALIIKKNYAIWAHAGDSRLYFFRGSKLVHRTEDHTYAEQLRLEGRYEDAEIASGRYKNILVSALGINKKPKIVIGEDAALREGDTFLLASDGMWAYFEDDELAEILQQLSPRDASERLVSLARERAEGRGDNLSVAIIKLEPQPREAQRGRA